MSTDIDLTRTLKIVRGTHRNWSQERNAAVVAKFWVSELGGKIYNSPDIGSVAVSNANITHAISSFEKSILKNAHFDIIPNIPELLAEAALIETHEDRSPVEKALRIHRLFSAVSIGNDVFSVKLTIKEYNRTPGLYLNCNLRFYDLHLPSKVPVATQAADPWNRRLSGFSRGAYSPVLGATPMPDRVSICDLLSGLIAENKEPYVKATKMATDLAADNQASQEEPEAGLTIS